MAWKQDPNDSSKMVPLVSREVGGKGSTPVATAVVASTGTDYAEARSVWVGRGGDITFTMADGNTADFHNVDDGTLLPIRVTKWADLGGSGAGTGNTILFLY